MDIPIPIGEMIEKGIAALPTNAAQSLKIRELTKQLALVEKKNAKLEAEIATLKPVSRVAVEAGKILQQFVEHGRDLSADQIAGLTEIRKGIVIHHLTTLRALGFIRQSRGRIDEREPPYRITPKGSSFLAERGML